MHKDASDERTDRGVSSVSHTGVLLLLLVRCTCFSAGITGMTCREVADTSLSDLAGLAQYCSSRLRSQLRKQHSSTIPRFWERRLFPLLVGLPEEEHNKQFRKAVTRVRLRPDNTTLALVMNLGCFCRITSTIIAVHRTKRIREIYDQLQQIFLFVEDNLISAIWKSFNV